MKKKLFPIVAIGLVLWLVLRPKKAVKPIPYGAPGNAQNGANAAAAGKALQQQQQSQGWLGDLFKAVGSIAKSVGGGGGSSGGGSVGVSAPGKAENTRPLKTNIPGGSDPRQTEDDTFSDWHDPLLNDWNYPSQSEIADPQGTFSGWSDPLDNPWNYPSPLDGNGLDTTEPDYGPAEFSPGDVTYQFLDSGPSYASFPFQPAASYVPLNSAYSSDLLPINSFGYPGSYTPVASPFPQTSDPFASSINDYSSWGSGSFGIPTFDSTYQD